MGCETAGILLVDTDYRYCVSFKDTACVRCEKARRNQHECDRDGPGVLVLGIPLPHQLK
jgi:hypothetical protein